MRKKLFLVLFGMVLGAAVLELVFQINYKGSIGELWQTTGAHRLDPELIYTLTPDYESYWTTEDFTEHAQTNSQGFRNIEITAKKQGSYRIVVVGDSFVYGHGISENEFTFPSQLEVRLKQQYPKKNIEVINTGVKGYSPDQEYRFITTRLSSLDPDLVIWEINPHDVYNLLSFPSLYDLSVDGRLIPTSAKMTGLFIKGWFIQNAPATLKKSKVVTAVVNFLPQIPWLNRVLFIPQKDRLGWAERKFASELIAGADFLKKKNIKLAVILFPVKYSYLDGEYKYPDDDINPVLERVSTELTADEFPIFDIGEDLWQKYDKRTIKEILKLFFPNDYHFNEKGVYEAAEIVAKHLLPQITPGK